MFFLLELEKDVLVHPSKFTGDLGKTIATTLKESLEGKCDIRLGYIIRIVKITDIGAGFLEQSLGYCSFLVKFTALIQRPFRSEIFDVVVSKVTKMGLFAEAGLLQIFIHEKQLPPGMKYDESTTPESFSSEDGSERIATGSLVRIKLISVRLEKNSIAAVGSMAGEWLG